MGFLDRLFDKKEPVSEPAPAPSGDDDAASSPVSGLTAGAEDAKSRSVGEGAILSPVSGRLMPAGNIEDPVFAKEMMGPTVGIEPSDGRIVFPADGVVEIAYPTGHAFGLRTASGAGLLVHIGIDTVEMQGEGFSIHFQEGDSVRAGELAVNCDLDVIRAAGHPATIMLILTEPVDGEDVRFRTDGEIRAGESIVE